MDKARLTGVTIVLFLLLGLVPGLLEAQQSEFKVLLPVAITLPVSGAHDSVWVTDFTVLNEGPEAYGVGLDDGCRFGPACPPKVLQPGRTIVASNLIEPAGGGIYPTNQLLFIEERGLPYLNFQLRVRDTSRAESSWGTEVPVIPESEAYTDVLQLLDVPDDSRFRAMLRVYDFDPGGVKEVAIRFYGVAQVAQFPQNYLPDELLAETTATFVTSPPGSLNPTAIRPGLIELSLSQLPGLEGADRLRIEIESKTEGLRFWAMASITNNDTQQVTLVTPNAK